MTKKSIFGAIILGILSWNGCGDDVKNNSETSKDAACLKESDCDSGVCLNGACAVVVGEGEACDSQKVCAKGFDCQDGSCVADGSIDPKPENCDPTTLSDDEDYDGDGILNRIEKNSPIGLDPCKADTDGDNAKDGEEDLNHDGQFQPELGETNPMDAADKRDPESQEGALAAKSCSADAVANGVTGHNSRFHVAKVADVKYYPDKENAETNVFRFETDKVVGFFGSEASITGTGEELLKGVWEDGAFAENSAFSALVPLSSWLKNGYDASLQRVPNHSVDRYKYAIHTNGKSLQELADALAKKFGAGSAEQYSGSNKCDGNATFYLARSVYKKGNIYSGAIVCDSDFKTPTVRALMDDILSGTLVFPSKTLDESVSDKGADAYKDFVCQIEDYGQSSAKVDLLWVIDNSGSMADELDNLSKSIPLFSQTLKTYGIDARMAVTTTDAYLLDEDPTAYKAYDAKNNYKIVLDDNTYLNGVGLRQDGKDYKAHRGFLDLVKDGEINEDNQNAIQSYISVNPMCQNPNHTGKNVCGFGYEDGLKSGAYALSRLAVDVNAGKAPEYYSKEDRANWKTIKDIKNGVTEGDADKQAEVSLRDEENNLLYVIWVSDEESRQFKERAEIAMPQDSKNTNPLFIESKGSICRTGYKLENGQMRTGAVDGLKESDCNPSMYDKLQQLIEKGTISEDSSMEEIEAAYPEYANMLKYYIKQYQNYAQGREIVGFAIVGDTGRDKGGFCLELATCVGTTEDGIERKCEEYASDGTTCLKCNSWDYRDAAATVGANYGLSYIHMARFLSSYYPDAPEKATKEGGKASICATDYSSTLTAIAEDFVGSLKAHPLKGYPIASSIRVSIIHDGAVKELTRNAATDGWAYDASQNSVTFKNVQNIKHEDKISITYRVWTQL